MPSVGPDLDQYWILYVIFYMLTMNVTKQPINLTVLNATT